MIDRKIAIIGLGYIGLPLAVAFGTKNKVIGYDKKQSRITELKKGYDRNLDVNPEKLRQANIVFTDRAKDLSTANFYIITVPTPVTPTKIPDLSFLLNASQTVAQYLKKDDIVIYESTVYPGATEEDCLPILEKVSKLTCGVDFKIGYSPERINPGDIEHTLENTIKIISAQDEASLEIIAHVYSQIATAGIYLAPNIKTAEAAKIIENTQRDLNISLINEVALIMHKLDIDTTEVLKAAQTKWNFLSYKPGLVGGHCIGIDPYYLTYKAQSLGYYPDVILAGRRINDAMSKFIAESTVKKLIDLGIPIKHSKIGILGITFKENCTDTRNSHVFNLIQELKAYHMHVIIHDPVVDYAHIQEEHSDLNLVQWNEFIDMDALILAVAHEQYIQMDPLELKQKLNYRGLIMDIKSILDPEKFQNSGIVLWRL